MSEEELVIENAVLVAENARLKKENRELKHLRTLDQTEIVNLRRQIELLVEGNNA